MLWPYAYPASSRSVFCSPRARLRPPTSGWTRTASRTIRSAAPGAQIVDLQSAQTFTPTTPTANSRSPTANLRCRSAVPVQQAGSMEAGERRDVSEHRKHRLCTCAAGAGSAARSFDLALPRRQARRWLAGCRRFVLVERRVSWHTYTRRRGRRPDWQAADHQPDGDFPHAPDFRPDAESTASTLIAPARAASGR